MNFLGLKKKRVYLDYAASTPIEKRVSRVLRRAERIYFGNPMGIHKEAVLAEKRKEKARAQIADFIGGRSEEIIFTGGSTERINLAIRGVIADLPPKTSHLTPHIVTTNIEHPAVVETLKVLEESGKISVTNVPVEKDGIVSAKKIFGALQKNTVLVSVMLGNNEIGTVQPIAEIAKSIRRYKKLTSHSSQLTAYAYPLLHVDATQGLQYFEINVGKSGIDLLSFDGAKAYGPKGVGVLYVRKGTPISKILYGGSQERGLRPGTHNTPGIIAIGETILLLKKEREKESKRLGMMLDRFAVNLSQKIPKIIINGSLENRMPNILSITIPGIDSELLAVELDARGIAVSHKSACKTKEDIPSHVLAGLGDPRVIENGAIRISFGRYTREKDLDYCVKAIEKICRKYTIIK